MQRRIGYLVSIASLCGCLGESAMTGEETEVTTTSSVCQTGNDCCKSEELVCKGNPDGTLVCTCHKNWICDEVLNPKKCSQQPADVPDGKSSWTCQTFLGNERCTSTRTEVPSGKNGWVCTKTSTGIECTRPTNTPDGSSGWICSYQGSTKLCEKNAPVTDAGVPGDLPGQQPTGDLGKQPSGWTCTKDAVGNTVCNKPESGTPGDGSWKCYWKNGTITCEGSSGGSAPGGGGWTCTENLLVGGYRCVKTVVPSSDQPPGGNGNWDCISDSVKGTTCIQPATPATGKECVPNQKMWCDGATYCGYGQVTCGPDGFWKTKTGSQGKKELDCLELPTGARPNTVCACYYYFFNPECCETPDCIVPPNSNGQICPASKGGICDYCNPEKPECVNGTKCVVTAQNETFCAQSCGGGKSCPAGYMCAQTMAGPYYNWVWECIPTDQSCYH